MAKVNFSVNLKASSALDLNKVEEKDDVITVDSNTVVTDKEIATVEEYVKQIENKK